MGQIDLTKAKFEVVDELYLEGDSLHHVTLKATNLEPIWESNTVPDSTSRFPDPWN